MNRIRISLIVVMVLLTACTAAPAGQALPTGTLEPPGTQAPLPAAPGLSPTAKTTTTQDSEGPLSLRLWVSPLFDPQAGTPTGDLLQKRLEEFTSRRPGIRVEVRIKSQEGPGGMLESLIAASAAAPLALPDLVVLPRSAMEEAALKGLLHPFDGLLSSSLLDEYYDYGLQLGRLQNSQYGVPIAGDALVLIYRPALIPVPPADFNTALITNGPLAFPAADPQALITLTLYQASGGAIQDEHELPTLDAAILEQVLAFYKQGGTAGLTPYWLSQFQTNDQAWEAFTSERANLVLTWASRSLSEPLADTAVAGIPTSDGSSFTLGSGWVWAMASPHPERYTACAELVEFLSAPEFLADLTESSGHLPLSPAVLAGWESTFAQGWVAEISPAVHLVPNTGVLNSLAPALEQATLQVIRQEATPAEAAHQAAARLVGP